MPFTGGVGGHSPSGLTPSRWLFSGTLNAIVMTAARTPTIAPATTHQLPGWRNWTTAMTPTTTASTAAPKYASRKAALEFASR